MPVTYQIQPSTLAPDGTTEPYARYAVILTATETAAVTGLTASSLAESLKLGKGVTLVDIGGTPIATIIPTLSGGFTLASSPTPTADQIGIGIKPSKQLLAMTRFEPTFNRVDTTFRQPAILSITSYYLNEPYDGIVINGAHSSYINIDGTYLKLDPENFEVRITAGTGVGSLQDYLMVSSGGSYIDWTDRKVQWLEKLSCSASPTPTTCTVTFSTGNRSVTLTVPVTDMT